MQQATQQQNGARPANSARPRTDGPPGDTSQAHGTSHEDGAPRRTASWRTLWRRGASIRIRVLAIALIPVLALLVTGVAAYTTLVNEARSAERWSEFLNKQLDPLITLIAAAQQERTASLMVLSGNPAMPIDLAGARTATDQSLAEIAVLAPQMAELHPQAVAKSNVAFAELLPRTPAIRQAVDQRTATAAEVDDFYTRLAGVIAMGLEGLALYTPDSQVAAEEMTASDLMRMADLHSRGAGIAGGAVLTAGDEPIRIEDRQAVTQLVGSYRNQITALTSRLTADEQQRLQRLTASPEWQTAVQAEDALALRGALPVSLDAWLAAELHVVSELRGVLKDHMRHANTLASSAAERSLDNAVWAGTSVATITAVALALAVLLANGLVRRLRSLRTRSLELANETLPSIVARLHDGEQVDIDAETRLLDRGSDEIGQVAEAFGTAQRTAMAAAAAEARTRAGFNRVFLDIAHRSQTVVRQQMDVLDTAQRKQEDPEHLKLLFQLDHLATRARRNAENLLILGGGQPGRRWREPVALEQLVRSAVSETEDLTRVSAVRVPDVRVLGKAVADLIHLLAELIDNATIYAPPDSLVTVRGNRVGRGVVVEVEDQGLGIRPEKREQLNELLRNPPDFEELALSGQRNLGLFVVGQLARRHGIMVSLQESPYGGIKAIVLVPIALLDQWSDSEADGPRADRGRTRTATKPRPAARRSDSDKFLNLPPWPGDEPATAATAPAATGTLTTERSGDSAGADEDEDEGWRPRSP